MAETQLDARVWGKLQDHIPLQCIHEKMPYEDFFRLGEVCKSWDQATLQRVEPKPYFVIIPLGGRYEMFNDLCLNGILTYDIATGKSSWRHQHFLPDGYSPLEVEGLIYCNYPYESFQPAVFNIHSNKWHIIPPPPVIYTSDSALGMTVDTSERPYSFKLFLGSINKKTQIYDSRTGEWSSRSSYLVEIPASLFDTSTLARCICSNGCIYLKQGHREKILKYSIERDIWTILRGPPLVEGISLNEDTLGTWEGRIFTTRENPRQSSIVVWELVDEAKNEWVEYAHLSWAVCEWPVECDFPPGHICRDFDMDALVTCFCGHYLLIYHWQPHISEAYGLLLFNLATKECKKVELPEGTIATTEEEQAEDD